MDSESNPIKLEHAFLADILKRIKVEGDDIEIKYEEVLGEADANETDKYSDVYVSNVAQKFKGYSHYNDTTLLSEVTDEKCECKHKKDHLELEDKCDIVNRINLSAPTNDDSVGTDNKESHKMYKKNNTEEKSCRFCFKLCCNCKTMNGVSKCIKREHSYDPLKRTQVEEDDVAIKYEVLGEADAIQCDEHFELDASSVGQRFKSYLHSNNTTLLSEVSDEGCEFNNQANHLEDNCNLVDKIKFPVAANAELVDMDSTEILEYQQNYERMKTQERICRFCFTICCNFKTIDGDIKEVSNVVLPGIDLAAIQEPVMCTQCEKILVTSFDFKARCLYTHDYLIQFYNKKDGVKLNLKDIYMNKNKNNISMLEDGNVCGFCMCPVENCSAKYLDVGERDVMLRNTLWHCLPELDLRIIKKHVICAPCHSSLEKHFRFVSDILIIEEKIKNYKRILDTNSNGGDIIKLEKICDSGASIDKGVENECTGSVDMDDLKFKDVQGFTPTNMLADEIECNKIGAIKIKEMFCGDDGTKFKEENIVKVEDQKVLLDEEIEIKTEELHFNSFENGIVTTQLNARLNGKQDRSVLTNFEDNLLKWRIQQTCVNKDVTRPNGCATFKAEKEYYRKAHFLKHMNPLEVTLHKCDSCAYQTKRKSNLTSHSLTHKDISDMLMYKCDLCAYQTIFKGNLKRHLLNHKDISEVTMHKCDSCTYQTASKGNFKLHLLKKHKDSLQVMMYKCESCAYQTIYKSNFNRHLLKHKDISEITAYKCDLCLYQTKNKSMLKIHFLEHKDPSEVTRHKCDSCGYQTIHKNHFKRHLLKHKDISEVTAYKCDLCMYQTKYKSGFNRHYLKHRRNLQK